MRKGKLLGAMALCLAVVFAMALATYKIQTVKADKPECKGIVCHHTGSGKFVGITIGLGEQDNTCTDAPVANNGHVDASGNPEHSGDIYLGPNPPFEEEDCPKNP